MVDAHHSMLFSYKEWDSALNTDMERSICNKLGTFFLVKKKGKVRIQLCLLILERFKRNW